ncbi:S41 family peptidase [Mesonia sp. K7]|uniref:S41 family peptidase n=1 Tax=Mesonia sp. K7 TaxID=2218606 RepID=UPI001F1C6111|nr:S41 family peptidase [Mesonia sp. K7]
MKKLKIALLFFLTLTCLTGCFKDLDDEIGEASLTEINDFIYKGLNIFYLYKADSPDLEANLNEGNTQEYTNFLNSYSSPEALFEHLLADQDRFSFLVSDYRVLESALNGQSLHNGMEFGLVEIQSTGEIFGYVRYVLPNTSASENNIERGMIFNRIDGQEFTESNYQQLLTPQTYTIGLATFQSGVLTPTEEEITLTKQEYQENPVYIAKTFEVEGHKIGYLMYNAFTSSFDGELNSAFADFKSAGVQDIVIDLRYNGGGSIETSNDLASMVTGQFEGQLFTTQVYNDNFDDQPRLFNNTISTGRNINSLNLNKLYVITTRSTASASELLLSSLMPYIETVQVGTTTTGKFEGSITLYDSNDFTRNGSNFNLGHHYAMQPLILKTVNAQGFTDYVNGLPPDIEQAEDFENLGVLGDINEPLLNTVINDITGNTSPRPASSEIITELLFESKAKQPTYKRMYVKE